MREEYDGEDVGPPLPHERPTKGQEQEDDPAQVHELDSTNYMNASPHPNNSSTVSTKRNVDALVVAGSTNDQNATEGLQKDRNTSKRPRLHTQYGDNQSLGEEEDTRTFVRSKAKPSSNLGAELLFERTP